MQQQGREGLTPHCPPLQCVPHAEPPLPLPPYLIWFACHLPQVLGEFQMVASSTSMRVGGMQVGHIAHLAGAAAGVLLVLLLSRLPEPAE